MGFVLGHIVRLELDGVPLGVEESVIPGPYTEGTQQDRPATAAEKEPEMGSANTSTERGMMSEVMEGLIRRGHVVTQTGYSDGVPWITVDDEDGNRYTITVERTQ